MIGLWAIRLVLKSECYPCSMTIHAFFAAIYWTYTRVPDAEPTDLLAQEGGVPPGCGTTLADGDLPSVMTCANYIKLPPYRCGCARTLRTQLPHGLL